MKEGSKCGNDCKVGIQEPVAQTRIYIFSGEKKVKDGDVQLYEEQPSRLLLQQKYLSQAGKITSHSVCLHGKASVNGVLS